jgi:hypothetical protein
MPLTIPICPNLNRMVLDVRNPERVLSIPTEKEYKSKSAQMLSMLPLMCQQIIRNA